MALAQPYFDSLQHDPTCVQQCLSQCRCKAAMHVTPSSVYFPTSAYYPKSCLLLFNRRLYIICFPIPGPHFIEAIMREVFFGRAVLYRTTSLGFNVYKSISAICVNPNGTLELLRLRIYTSRLGIPLVFLIKSLQRWARRLITHRKQAKMLALAMGLHRRLGSASALQVLSDDAVFLVVKKIA